MTNIFQLQLDPALSFEDILYFAIETMITIVMSKGQVSKWSGRDPRDKAST